MSQLRIVGQWAESEIWAGQWAAAAEAHPNAPIMIMQVSQLPNGRWAYEVWYAYDPGERWRQDGFEAREGAQASAELKVHRLQGGGGR